MALDKQRILSELGNVMNQLQSADCGCMGKMFSSPKQGSTPMGNPLPTCGGCRRGCCHGHGQTQGYCHGYPPPSAGEPHTPTNQHCMGHCNPPKLYADTYGYLNKNLMQPVVREVYNDLKSITPDNTVMNNPMADQMGLSGHAANAQPTMHGNVENVTQMPGGGMDSNLIQSRGAQQQMSHMGGMGPQIVNMMFGEGGSNSNNMAGQGGQMEAPMVADVQGSRYGNTPNENHSGNANQVDFNGRNMASMGNSGMGQQNTTDMYGGNGNSQINPMTQNNLSQQRIGNINANQTARIPKSTNQTYGQHAQGIAKFNEMFPGVMQGLGGDLNFDPMGIAIQMNPENKQRAAIDAMKQMMVGNGLNKVMDKDGNATAMQPAITGAKAAAGEVQPPSNQTQQNNFAANQQGQQGQQVYNNDVIANQSNQIPQQVFSAYSGAPTINQQQPQQYQTQQHHQPQQQIIDPNTGAVLKTPMLPTLYEGSTVPNQEIQQKSYPQSVPPIQQMIKEPIFPADTSKNQQHFVQQQKYNTLGQPVEMLPSKMYHTPEPNLPQTLAPQALSAKLRNDPMKYSNVKATVSKTSIMGSKPFGKTPSRTQLQQIYNQYKGSQSFTQQNIKTSGHGGTQSEGQLKVARDNAKQLSQVPVERVGGDTVANNQMANETSNKIEQVLGQIGDAPAAKPQGDGLEKALPSRHSKCRNGLQDVVYTSYPSSAAWSFHGNSRAPFSAGYRFRNKA